MTAERFAVEAGHVMMFARSLGDANPAYLAAGAPAPPTFTVISAHYDPTSPLRPQPGQPWRGSGRTPTGTPGAGDGEGWLHAEQHFEYHRLVQVGDVLTPSARDGERWTKKGSNGATLEFAEEITEYRDANGELAITARKVRVRRTVASSRAGRARRRPVHCRWATASRSPWSRS